MPRSRRGLEDSTEGERSGLVNCRRAASEAGRGEARVKLGFDVQVGDELSGDGGCGERTGASPSYFIERPGCDRGVAVSRRTGGSAG